MVLEQYISNQYVRAFVVLLILVVTLRLLVSIITKVVFNLVKRTKTEVDDIIVRKSSGPITIILLLFSIRIAINQILITQGTEIMISRALYTAVIITLGYLAYVFLNVVIFSSTTRITKGKIDQTVVSLIHTVIQTALIVVAAIYILDLYGVEVGPLLAGLGIAGLAVALALQPTLSNIFSGISLILDKSTRVGDYVCIDNIEGKIDKIGLRSTKIRTFDNEFVIVPNSNLANARIKNMSLPEPKSRITIKFNIEKGADIEKIKKTVLKELKSIKGQADYPDPDVRLVGIVGSILNFEAYFYVTHPEMRWEATDEANTKIHNALKDKLR